MKHVPAATQWLCSFRDAIFFSFSASLPHPFLYNFPLEHLAALLALGECLRPLCGGARRTKETSVGRGKEEDNNWPLSGQPFTHGDAFHRLRGPSHDIQIDSGEEGGGKNWGRLAGVVCDLCLVVAKEPQSMDLASD